MALQAGRARHEVVPLKVDEVADVPRGVERPPRDKGAVYHTSNPLSLEKDVKRGHEGQGSQEHKEGELNGFPFETRQVVEPMYDCPKDRQTNKDTGV